MESVPITTKVLSSNPTHGEVYLIQHYVIKFVSDMQEVCSFLRLPSPIKLTATIDIAEILWKVVLNTKLATPSESSMKICVGAC